MTHASSVVVVIAGGSAAVPLVGVASDTLAVSTPVRTYAMIAAASCGSPLPTPVTLEGGDAPATRYETFRLKMPEAVTWTSRV
jgi:hypothetical protein